MIQLSPLLIGGYDKMYLNSSHIRDIKNQIAYLERLRDNLKAMLDLRRDMYFQNSLKYLSRAQKELERMIKR